MELNNDQIIKLFSDISVIKDRGEQTGSHIKEIREEIAELKEKLPIEIKCTMENHEKNRHGSNNPDDKKKLNIATIAIFIASLSSIISIIGIVASRIPTTP